MTQTHTTQKTAIVQTAEAGTNAATEALDVALALASMDQWVQLVLLDDAVTCLEQNPSKRYAMMEMLDAEPILLCREAPLNQSTELDIELWPRENLAQLLAQYDEVLTFS